MGVYKVQTIGDAYIAVTGMVQPTRDSDLGEDDATVSTLSFRQNDAVALAKFALAMLKEIAKVEVPNDRCAPLNMRIGLHVGRVVAGVVGTKKFRYDIWGKDVMTARRRRRTELARAPPGGWEQIRTGSGPHPPLRPPLWHRRR